MTGPRWCPANARCGIAGRGRRLPRPGSLDSFRCGRSMRVIGPGTDLTVVRAQISRASRSCNHERGARNLCDVTGVRQVVPAAPHSTPPPGRTRRRASASRESGLIAPAERRSSGRLLLVWLSAAHLVPRRSAAQLVPRRSAAHLVLRLGAAKYVRTLLAHTISCHVILLPEMLLCNMPESMSGTCRGPVLLGLGAVAPPRWICGLVAVGAVIIALVIMPGRAILRFSASCSAPPGSTIGIDHWSERERGANGCAQVRMQPAMVAYCSFSAGVTR